MNSQNPKKWIPGVITLAVSFIVNSNEPALIATESFRYFSLFIVLSGLSSMISIILLFTLIKHYKGSDKIALAIFYLYTIPAIAFIVIFIGASDIETIEFIMSFL